MSSGWWNLTALRGPNRGRVHGPGLCQRLVLGVHIGGHREARGGMSEPLADHSCRDFAQVHEGPAGVPSVMQSDDRETGQLGQVPELV